MGYNNGRLLVEKDGHYYLYSKVTINAAEECKLIQHTVMKVTKAYDAAIELMKSKRFVIVKCLISFLCCCTWAYKHLVDLNLLCVFGSDLVNLLCDTFGMFPLVSVAGPKNQVQSLQKRRIFWTASWQGSSTCRAEMRSLSDWKIYTRCARDLLTIWWGPLW